MKKKQQAKKGMTELDKALVEEPVEETIHEEGEENITETKAEEQNIVEDKLKEFDSYEGEEEIKEREVIQEEQQEENRNLPTSDLDLNLMMTNSVWGRPEVSKELKDKLSKYYIEEKGDGSRILKQESLWGVLSYYTRDIRLGNLSEWNGELASCRHYLDLAGQLLQANMIEPFIIALSKAITILETSQSKGGFLRRAMNTLRQEHVTQDLTVPQKTFFGGAKKDNGGM